VFEQAGAGEPRRPIARRNDVVAVQRADGYRVEARPFGQGGEVVADSVEDAAIEVDQVHLVHGKDELGDAEQPGDPRVAPRLRHHPVTRVDEEDGEVCRRRPGCHIARVLFVARRVGEDELAPCRGEIAVRHVDRDPLLALGAEPVGEEREVNRPGSPVLRRRFDRPDLILIHAA
jgi:hypothetical protein